MFFQPEADSPGALNEANTPNQSRMPVSRQESASTSQVDPILLANRLADIPNVSNSVLTPAGINSRLNSVESPPYGPDQ